MKGARATRVFATCPAVFRVKLHPDPRPALNTVTAYGRGFVEVNEVRLQSSSIVVPDEPIVTWRPARFEDVTADDLDAVIGLHPEIIIFGAGERLRFLAPPLLKRILAQRIGIECMDLHAACRTYNILMSEGRRVAAALVLGESA